MVTYNSSAGTWHCPCAKPRMSCPHKNIAKWHLFQTNQNIFSTEKATKLSDTSCPQHSDELIDTPPIDLQSTVEYIYNKNKIPGNLQEAAAESNTFPSRYLPVETTCMICDGEIALDEPALITAKAKIITIESVIDGKFNIQIYSFIIQMKRNCSKLSKAFVYVSAL